MRNRLPISLSSTLIAAALLVVSGCSQPTNGSDGSSDDGSSSGPSVESLAPNDGASGVPLDTSLDVSFSTEIDPETATSGGITVSGGGNTLHASSYTCSGTDCTFGLGSGFTPLSPDTQYDVTVSTDVKTDDGTSLAEARTSTFTTSTDGTAPSVSEVTINGNTVTQQSGTTGVSTTGPTIAITFSEEVREPGSNTTNYDQATGGDQVIHSVTKTSADTLTVETSDSLNSDTQYYFAINVVKDVAGNTLEDSTFQNNAGFIVYFETAAN